MYALARRRPARGSTVAARGRHVRRRARQAGTRGPGTRRRRPRTALRRAGWRRHGSSTRTAREERGFPRTTSKRRRPQSNARASARINSAPGTSADTRHGGRGRHPSTSPADRERGAAGRRPPGTDHRRTPGRAPAPDGRAQRTGDRERVVDRAPDDHVDEVVGRAPGAQLLACASGRFRRRHTASVGSDAVPDRFLRFDRDDWALLRAATPMTFASPISSSCAASTNRSTSMRSSPSTCR